MSDAVADVSTTMRNVLTAALSTLGDVNNPAPIAEIHDLQANIQTNPPKLTIFLFDVTEDPSARNRPRVRSTTPPNITITKPPMALLLRYLLTPWSGSCVTDQRIIARAMQVLYDQAILSGTALVGSLAGTDFALKLTLAPLSLEERTRVWHSVQRPYRLSVSYDVRVVNVETEVQEQVTPVSRRTIEPALPEPTP